jgi:predicted component of type VI protein secretion system
MKAELVPENGDEPIPIVRDVTVVGRHVDCDVVIEHQSLSKRHCVLVKTDGLLVIRDLATTNGTKVKGQRVRWAALLPEDRVSLGGYKLRIYLGSDEMPSPSELRRERAALASEAPSIEIEPRASLKGYAGQSGGPATDRTAREGVVPARNGRESAVAGPVGEESKLLGDGFEIIDDDDDEIIDLD